VREVAAALLARARATVQFRPGRTGADRGLAAGGASEGSLATWAQCPGTPPPVPHCDSGEFRQQSMGIRPCARVCLYPAGKGRDGSGLQFRTERAHVPAMRPPISLPFRAVLASPDLRALLETDGDGFRSGARGASPSAGRSVHAELGRHESELRRTVCRHARCYCNLVPGRRQCTRSEQWSEQHSTASGEDEHDSFLDAIMAPVGRENARAWT